MRYRVKLSLPAIVEVVLELDAESQQDAIVAGYDRALAATPSNVTIVSVTAQSAMLDSCEVIYPLDEAAVPPANTEQLAPAVVATAAKLAKRYCVRFYNTPEALEEAQPDKEEWSEDYNDAVALCRALTDDKDGYCRRVHDHFDNKLFEMQNEIGRYVLVVYPSETAYAAREYQPWSGWHLTAKDARKAALVLLDAGKVFAVGVVDANTSTTAPTVMMTLTRSSV